MQSTVSRPSSTAVFTSNVRAAIARANTDRGSLAKALGRDRAYVSKRLNGHAAVSLSDVDAFAKALDTTPEALMKWGES